MATKSVSVQVPTPQDLETMTMSYIAQGYNVANKTPMQVTLIKRKQFSYFWAVIGFIFCLLPLVIYLIVYALESDQMAVITVAGVQQPSTTGQLNPSQPLTSSGVLTGGPSTDYLNAPRSPDGLYWWDGQAWQLVPQDASTGPMRPQLAAEVVEQQPASEQTTEVVDQQPATEPAAEVVDQQPPNEYPAN